MLEDVVNNTAVEEQPIQTESVATDIPEVGADLTDAPEKLTDEERQVKKENRVQKRINTLTREKFTEKGRADALQAELDRLRTGGQAPQQNTSGEPDPNSFSTPEEYNKALIRFEAGKIASQEVARVQQQQQTQVLKNRWDTEAKELRKTHEDFDEAIQDFLGSPYVTPVIDKAIAETDHPAGITHYLATHTEEAERIAGLSEYRAAIEIGKIESKITASREHRKVSAAPAPIKPVGAPSPGGGAFDPEKSSPKEFAAHRNKQEAERRKRR